MRGRTSLVGHLYRGFLKSTMYLYAYDRQEAARLLYIIRGMGISLFLYILNRRSKHGQSDLMLVDPKQVLFCRNSMFESSILHYSTVQAVLDHCRSSLKYSNTSFI
jgi:hypothetical protein